MFTVGCGQKPDPDKADGRTVCVLGWWRCACPLMQCDLPCQLTPPNPECVHGDCTQVTVEGYRADRRLYQGMIAFSDTAREVSSVAPDGLTWTYYSTTDGGIVFDTDAGLAPQPLSCSDVEMIAGNTRKVRLDRALAAALDRAVETGVWQRVPYP